MLKGEAQESAKGLGGQTLAGDTDVFWRMEKFLEGDGRSDLEFVGENEVNLWGYVQRKRNMRDWSGKTNESEVLEVKECLMNRCQKQWMSEKGWIGHLLVCLLLPSFLSSWRRQLWRSLPGGPLGGKWEIQSLLLRRRWKICSERELILQTDCQGVARVRPHSSEGWSRSSHPIWMAKTFVGSRKNHSMSRIRRTLAARLHSNWWRRIAVVGEHPTQRLHIGGLQACIVWHTKDFSKKRKEKSGDFNFLKNPDFWLL